MQWQGRRQSGNVEVAGPSFQTSLMAHFADRVSPAEREAMAREQQASHLMAMSPGLFSRTPVAMQPLDDATRRGNWARTVPNTTSFQNAQKNVRGMQDTAASQRTLGPMGGLFGGMGFSPAPGGLLASAVPANQMNFGGLGPASMPATANAMPGYSFDGLLASMDSYAASRGNSSAKGK